ncbi:MAG: hypothetical protein IPP07_06395 [Holophagales bacterium]|nr:hypothetical protein [Holophagales bacterium]MBK9964533.1 hypothetical protein [Holophagales bacterium]
MPKLCCHCVFTLPLVVASTAGGLLLPVVSAAGEPILPQRRAAPPAELRA